MSLGYFKVWRQLEDSDLWATDPLTIKIWLWILMHACYKEQRLPALTLQPGELVTTYAEIMEAMVVPGHGFRKRVAPSIQTVRTSIQALCNLYAISKQQAKHQGGLHIKVLHWEEYQGLDTEPTTGYATDISTPYKNEKIKNKKKEQTLVVSDDEQAVFDRWKEVIGANDRTQLDAPRLGSIRWAITHYGLDGAMDALQGLANDSWSMEGPFSRREIKMVFRDAAHIERYMNAAVKKLTPIQLMMQNAGLEVR